MSVNRERVDLCCELVAQGVVHEPMPAHARNAAKAIGDNHDAEVTTTIRRAGVTGVLRALIFNDQALRGQRLG